MYLGVGSFNCKKQRPFKFWFGVVIIGNFWCVLGVGQVRNGRGINFGKLIKGAIPCNARTVSCMIASATVAKEFISLPRGA